MPTKQNAEFFENEWFKYMAEVDLEIRAHVDELITFTKKKEEELKEAKEAKAATVRPKPGDDELEALKADLDANALDSIENAAGAPARKLIEDLLEYAENLVKELKELQES